ncbi:hypothetical protein QN397_25955 [Variovorax sp. RTB1]|uniref:hypothetical protein n=1 Tax=Variovorax sp. RTB1 TaxID=3048631 RepID=UPI002B23C81E|nr:hypothetical protein [Variovorax sp. RTB1]MEB0114724.1 hypothetical protein [Variovorax sp. RTB1]
MFELQATSAGLAMEQALLKRFEFHSIECVVPLLNDYLCVQEDDRMRRNEDRWEIWLAVLGVMLVAGGGVALAFVTR